MGESWESLLARLCALIQLTPDLMLITDADGRIEYLNRAFGAASVGDHVGTSLFAFVSPSTSGALKGCLERVLASGQIDGCEVELIHDQRAPRRIALRVGPVDFATPFRTLAVHGRDVSERQPATADGATSRAPHTDEQRQRHLENLAHAGRLSTMGQLVAAIAHEINQPLYAITNYAGACHNALQSPSDNTQRQLPHWIKEIEVQARRAGLILSKLGDFARKSPPEHTVFDLNKLVITSLDLLRLEARSRQIRVGLELASPVPYVVGDHIQIEQILVNLLRNGFDALEHVPPGERRVVVKTELASALVRVHVEDCGQGVPADELPQLFEPFYTTKERGMGMGLAISRSIIEAHGGRLWATCNPVAGLTVHFEMPLQPVGGP